MSTFRGGVTTLLTLTVLIVTADCDGGKSIPVNEYIQQLVRDELQSIVSTLQSGTEPMENRLESRMEALERRMESRLESIDDRLTLLDSRMEELTGRLDGQQTQLDEVVTQLNGQKSQQDETTATVNDHTERLSAIATNMEKHVSEMRTLATRLDSQQSQLSELKNQLDEQKTTQSEVSVRMDTLNSQFDFLETKLTGAVNNTSSQQERIDGPAAKVHHLAPASDCSDLPVDSPSGVYLLRPSGDSRQPPVEAYCDMDTAGGNWTVFQRRNNIEPRQDFYLRWTDYKEGFGNVTKEFWWGLEHLYQLTSSDRPFELRIDLEAFDGNRSYAVYQGFSVSFELDGYRLSASNYSGTARDSLQFSVNEKFSTRDRDQDSSHYHCAKLFKMAWWVGRGWTCGHSSLNGRYRDGGITDIAGIWWLGWRGYQSLKKTEMKIRPTD